MKKLPLARNEDFVVQSVGNETLIYNLSSNKAYCLNETSAVVFNHCDGKTSFDELKRKYNFTDELIYLALDNLQRENLIGKTGSAWFGDLTRREVIRRIGLTTAVAIPAISMLVAPTASSAATLVCQSSAIPLGEDFGVGGIHGDVCANVAPGCCFTNEATNPVTGCCSGNTSFVSCTDIPQFDVAQCICHCNPQKTNT